MPQQGVGFKTSGERRHKATLWRATATTDELGGLTDPTWTQYESRYWVSITPTPFVRSESEHTVIYVLEGPYRSDVEIKDRVIVNGKTLQVLELVNVEEMGRSLQLHCARPTQ